MNASGDWAARLIVRGGVEERLCVGVVKAVGGRLVRGHWDPAPDDWIVGDPPATRIVGAKEVRLYGCSPKMRFRVLGHGCLRVCCKCSPGKMDEASRLLDVARAVGMGTNRRQITSELRGVRGRCRWAQRSGDCDGRAWTGAGRSRRDRGRAARG